jgi:hypothetical protein
MFIRPEKVRTGVAGAVVIGVLALGFGLKVHSQAAAAAPPGRDDRPTVEQTKIVRADVLRSGDSDWHPRTGDGSN